MQVRWGRTLARTLVVCACIPALATAGAYASTTAKEESDRRELEKAPCANGPTISGAVPLDTLKACGTSTDVEPAEDLSNFTQLGPIVLQRAATATAGDYNTSSVPTIGTLVPFASFTIPSGSFPADVEILPSDPVHVYELMNTGAVRSYTTAGVSAAVSTVAPPVGETWTDMAVDPTTGTVYALSSNSTCTTAKLFTVNLLAGTSSAVGATTISGCMVGLLADNSGNLFGHNIAADSLMAINKTTGAGTTVGPVGFDGNFGQSADCDPGSGTCYLFAFNATAFRGELRSLNLTTGASTLVNPIGSIAPGGTVQISGGVFGTFGICQVNSDCNDGNACNGVETCDTGSGNCIPGTPVVCDDGQQCTLNQCDPATGSCNFPPNPCSDGDPCTLDTCDNVNGCQHSTPGLVRLCSSGSISIPDSGTGTPYPSNIVASGLSTNSSLCSVELRGITHTFPSDIDMLLKGPVSAAQNAIIMSDAGGSTAVTNVDLLLTDGAASDIPTVLVTGTYRPTNIGTGDTFPAPAPAPAGGSSLGVFTGNPNGTWSLFVVDDAGGDLGSITGWCLNIVQAFCTSDNDCNDGNLCNGIETCNSGQCVSGTPINCDDGNQCTTDACVPATGACTHAPNPCSDGDGCTVDTCSPTNGCQHTPKVPVTFCNTSGIIIPNSGNGTPYPSSIPVSGVGPSSSLCSVTLRGITHTFPSDIDMLMVGPAGGTQNTTLMSDAGGGTAVTGVDLQLKDTAPTNIPTPLVTGTYKPTNIGTGDIYPAPAPAPQGGTTPNFSAFTGNLNGTWNLFVVDDAGGDLGSVSAWCVSIVVGSCSSNTDCDDGNPCNGAETCVDTVCTPGTPVDCSDGNPCTQDVCQPSNGSCTHPPTNCSDGNGCTADFCDPSTGCQHADHCTEVCAPQSIIIPDSGPANPYPANLLVNVGPVNGVFSLAAVKVLGLTHTFPGDLDIMLSGPSGPNNVVLMSDQGAGNDVTNVNLTFADGAPPVPAIIVSGTYSPTNTDTTDSWPAPAPAPQYASTLGVFNGIDPNGTWKLWVVDDAAQDLGSISGGYCLELLISCTSDTQCDDGNACTDDACVQGQCTSSTTSCDDDNECTLDTCSPTSGCGHQDIVCDDNNACTNEVCDPNQGCVYTDVSCDDDNACTDDYCDTVSGCGHTDVICDDDNACTSDSCDPDSGCVYTDISGSCDDGNPCTDDVCRPDTGCGSIPNNDPCDDGNACTTGDACESRSCQPGTPVVCSDGTACTTDSCDPDTGCVYTPVAGIEPNPHGNGYWQRLCHGPHSGDELTDADAACVAGQGDKFAGISTVADICAVLQQGGQGGTCAHTTIDLMSTALNLCHVEVCEATPIDSQYSSNDTVGESYDQADDILAGGGDCSYAKGLLEEINTGRAIHVDGVTLARAAGGGARLNWTPMGGGSTPVTKYNVWRRVAGSMDAFVKIGETTNLTFNDVSPGKFEYEVTPVR